MMLSVAKKQVKVPVSIVYIISFDNLLRVEVEALVLLFLHLVGLSLAHVRE